MNFRKELQIESYYWNEVNSLQQQIERLKMLVDIEVADFDTLWSSALRQNHKSREILLSIETTETLFNLTHLQYNELEKIRDKCNNDLLPLPTTTKEEELQSEIYRLNEIIQKVALDPEKGVFLAQQEIKLRKASDLKITQTRDKMQNQFSVETDLARKLKIIEETEKRNELLKAKAEEEKNKKISFEERISQNIL